MMNIDEQVEWLMQGSDYGDPTIAAAMAKELGERLAESARTGKPLNVYCGYDPTSSDLHLGHTVTMRKLRQFQELGHNVTFLIGNFTSLIGDPTDKDKARPSITAEQVMENAKTYAEQAFRVLDPERTAIKYNADWLKEVKLEELFRLAANFTAQQVMARENFHNRLEANEPIYLHEFFYPLSQGFDAHHLEADVQVGGTDQLYNIVTASRKIMASYGQKPNIGLLMPLLPGTDGVQKMSKSLGNIIPINTTADDMYGKVMSLPDNMMITFAHLTSGWSLNEIHQFEAGIKENTLHPRDAKMQLAKGITKLFYGVEAAEAAQNNFITMFQQGSMPDEIPDYALSDGETVLDVMLKAGLAGSKSQARRLIDQQGVKLDSVTVSDSDTALAPGSILQVGKRHYLRIK